MRGSLVNRGKNRWALVLDLGYVVDPATEKKRRQQKWITFHGTKPQAQTKLNDLVHGLNRGEFVEPTKRTIGEWLDEWLEKSVKPTKRLRTYETYRHVVTGSLKPALGMKLLQALKPLDVQGYFSSHATLSAATLGLHAAILSSALRSAVKNGLVSRNVVPLADGKPKVVRSADDVMMNCWTLDDARAFLTTAKTAASRPAAFYALALDSGARLGELCGVRWSDVDLDAGMWTLVRQLIKAGHEPVFGPPKKGRSRKIALGAETCALLREHKRHQAELKLKNRLVYRSDLDLVFAKEAPELFVKHDQLGLPLQMGNLGRGEFARLVAAAHVRPITFHGLRHTSATLLLMAGVPAKVVSERLGHSKIAITLDVYSHVLPGMQQAAAASLGALLHG
jgi:integrase